MTREQITQRLEKLKAEFASGQQMLTELEAKQANLKTTLLRISGAIQVLEELLAESWATQPENQTEIQQKDGAELPTA